MYILEILQADRRHVVGLFRLEEEIKDWIGKLSYVKKEEYNYEDIKFEDYTLEYDKIPIYDEVIWKGSKFPISKFMFVPNQPHIMLNWYRIPILEDVNGMIDGSTQVDAYIIPNKETKEYIRAREEMRKFIEDYYTDKGMKLYPGGLGSEDGEYISVENGPFIILDAGVVDLWNKKESLEKFIDAIEN